MSTSDTIRAIVDAETVNKRVQQLRLVPERHGAGDQIAIFSAVARQLYVKDLAPDFAYVHDAPFYGRAYFESAYQTAERLTRGFRDVSEADLARTLYEAPETLLVFRTMLGLTREEFAHATSLVAALAGYDTISASKVDSLERRAFSSAPAAGAATEKGMQRRRDAQLAAATVARVMAADLFGEPPQDQRLKQDKPDTEAGWDTIRRYAEDKVPLSLFLHQRHYGGAFRQLADATSGRRGGQLEDEVQRVFAEAGVKFVRTGSTDQGLIKERFNITVTPAPDFVVYDPADGELRAMLECKGTNNGGTARDKAARFKALRQECVRLGGVALFAVLGGIGWARVNDALAPVVAATEGRVFTLSTLDQMLEVNPFPSLRAR